MGTYAITGAASGIGAATKARLEADGHRVIGVDLHNTDVNADLSTPEGRAEAIAKVTELAGESLDGFVPFAGLAAATGRPGSLMVSVNYFGAIEVLEGLYPLLAKGTNPSVVLISSNSTTCQPNWPVELAELCLAGDEAAAREAADKDPMGSYPAAKAALAYYVRTKAVADEWIGAGIRLNAIAPGLIETPMVAAGKVDPLTAEGMKMFPLPIGRGGRPEEIAELTAFLLGPTSSFFVGSVLFCDGGTDALFHAKDWPKVWELDLSAFGG
ncbi:SDR family oxidoreductase [Yinghuangia aomiensis]|uniref:SDR family oxidoreductase n=1 Tax=Yinghuangia aomiensis TaxID=676205 RepID=A0ABP9GQF1_9ACTN